MPLTAKNAFASLKCQSHDVGCHARRGIERVVPALQLEDPFATSTPHVSPAQPTLLEAGLGDCHSPVRAGRVIILH